MTDYELNRYYGRKWLIPDWAYFVFAATIVGGFVCVLTVLTIAGFANV